jgi:hypothetical protein
MPRKDFDLREAHLEQIDRLKAERRTTYSELLASILNEYFAPRPKEIPADLTTQFDGLRSSLEVMQQRLWGLDSAGQKTVERLGHVETQLEGLSRLQQDVQQVMELLILIADRVSPPPADELEPIPEPVQQTAAPRVEEPPITDIYHDPRSRWYIPPEPVEERRGWFGRKKS